MSGEEVPGAPVQVRVPGKTRDQLHRLAEQRHRSIGAVITDIVSEYEDERFRAACRSAPDEIRADPADWSAFRDEAAIVEGTLMDGLADDPADGRPDEATDASR